MKNHAFSLVELMVVIAIVGIIAAIGFPVYKDYAIRARVLSSFPVAELILAKQKEYYSKHGQFGAVAQLGFPVGNAYYSVLNPSQYAPYINEISINGGAGAFGGHVCSDGTKFGTFWIVVNSPYTPYTGSGNIGYSGYLGYMYIIRDVNGAFLTKCMYDAASVPADVAARYLPASCQKPAGNTAGTQCYLPW